MRSPVRAQSIIGHKASSCSSHEIGCYSQAIFSTSIAFSNEEIKAVEEEMIHRLVETHL